jgi:hypothetical protein
MDICAKNPEKHIYLAVDIGVFGSFVDRIHDGTLVIRRVSGRVEHKLRIVRTAAGWSLISFGAGGRDIGARVIHCRRRTGAA